MSDLVRLSLSIEKSLFNKLEALVADSSYHNRSEFVRDLIRNCLVEREWDTDKVLLGTISLLYDHHTHGLSAKLTHRQHQFPGRIYATTHVHLNHDLCAEMIMVRGKGRDIRALADQLRCEKGELHAKLAMGSMGEGLT